MYGIYYLIYSVLSILLLLVIHRRNSEDKQSLMIRLVVVLCLPIVGWLFPMVWSNNRKANSHEQFLAYMEQQQLEYQLNQSLFRPIEKQKEMNIVPLEDALVVSSHQERRRALIEVLKQDTIQYIEVLQRAMSNDDTETSHYAVSAIMEIKSKLLNALQELAVKYEQGEYDRAVSEAYLEALSNYLKSGFIDERTKRKYQYTFLAVITQYLEHEHNEEDYLLAKLEMEMELGIMVDAERTALHYVDLHPFSERSYLALLKLYYNLRSFQKFEEALERLKQAPIKLSYEGITIVRYWTKGASDEAVIRA